MFWLKACPRCHGDLYREEDIFGIYLACLQCGHELGMIEELNLHDPLGKFVGEESEAVFAHAA